MKKLLNATIALLIAGCLWAGTACAAEDIKEINFGIIPDGVDVGRHESGSSPSAPTWKRRSASPSSSSSPRTTPA